MSVLKEVRLIKADIGKNNNKFWTGILHDNGDVECTWGRVGNSGQSKTFCGVGERYLDKKAGEKERKGYKQLKVVAANSNVEVKNSSLKDIIKKQVKTCGNPELDKLIDKLIRANVHKITSSTNISFNENSGLFSTPLGVITLEAIDDARDILVNAQTLVAKRDFKSRKWNDYLNDYLTLVPQDIGMSRITAESFFPDAKSVSAQSDILDSLEASYNAMQQDDKPKDKKKDQPMEKVFELELKLVGPKQFSRIEDKYHKTRKDMHVCSHLKVKKVFEVRIGDMHNQFQTGKSVGNVNEFWHGTSMANLLSIMKSGLHKSPPSAAHISGKMYGNGIYFAKDSTKSLNYAYGYWSGTRNDNCYMFLADVAMGNEYVPSGYDSSVESKVKKGGYHSCWAKANKSGVRNDECIVYNDNQCNLTYLVEFDR
jgi:poly [ADP-ribose] polymerase